MTHSIGRFRKAAGVILFAAGGGCRLATLLRMCLKIRRRRISKHALRLLACGWLSGAVTAAGENAAEKTSLSQDQQDRQTCNRNMLAIYDAVQAFRKDHKELPNWLSDLVPQYLPNTNVLICPISLRTGRKHSFDDFKDPRANTSYIYQFCAGPASPSFDPLKNMSQADFKRLQMALVGGGTPILSCALHPGGWLHLSFDGQPYETKEYWEARFVDVVPPAELGSARRMAAKFGKAVETAMSQGNTNQNARARDDAKDSSDASSSPETPRSWPWWAYALGAGGGFYLFAAGIVALVSLRRSR